MIIVVVEVLDFGFNPLKSESPVCSRADRPAHGARFQFDKYCSRLNNQSDAAAEDNRLA